MQLDGNSRWAGYEGKGSVKDNVVVLTYSLSLMEGGGRKKWERLSLAEGDPELVLNMLTYWDTSWNINQAAGTMDPEYRGNVWGCVGRQNRKRKDLGFSWTPAVSAIYTWISSAVCFCYICLMQSRLSAYFPYLSWWWATRVCLLHCWFICCCLTVHLLSGKHFSVCLFVSKQKTKKP